MPQTLDSEPLSHVDAAWLRMDSTTNPMVITAALIFDGPVPFDAVERVVRERFLPHVRFRQRVVDSRLPLVSPHWELDPHFDLRSHLHHVRLPAPGGERAFEDLVSDLMSSRLDPERPLWQTFVVDDAPGGTAIVARIHHCIADGVSLVKILLSLLDEVPARGPQAVGLPRQRMPLSPGLLARRVASQTATLGRLLLMPPDAPSPLRGALGIRKRAARARPIPLAPLKELARRHQGKLNDVLVAAVTGTLRAFLLELGALPDDKELRTLVPVFLQGDAETGLGNHFGLVFLDLPLNEDEPAQRIREVKVRMDKLKAQDDATIGFAVLDALGLASHELEHLFLEVFSRKASLLTSNVPGPAETALMAGYKLRDLVVWAPVAGYLGLGITLISYAGQVHMAVHADVNLLPDPKRIALLFEQEIERMLGVALSSNGHSARSAHAQLALR